jgi:hypothetical protein
MAGRPVAVRTAGGGGLLYGLITFVIISVVALGGMIFALTNVKQAEDDAARLRARLDQIGEPSAYYRDEASARRTKAVTVLESDLGDLAKLVTGNPQMVRPAISEEARRLLSGAAKVHDGVVREGSSLFDALRALEAELTNSKKQIGELRGLVSALEAERDGLVAGLKAARDEYQASVEELRNDLLQTEKDKTDAIAAKDAQLQALEASVTGRTEELNRERSQATSRRQEYEIALMRQQNQMSDMRKQLEGLRGDVFNPEEILRKADGRVLRAIPGSDVVYVNVGSRDGARPGLGFEVYSEQPDPGQTVRGKASIEIVSTTPTTAECRVTRSTAGQPIIEGDLIVNVTFERNYKPKFVVRGSFDLNYDGIVDSQDAERIAAMIRDWGGQVAPDLDETTNYVVIGVAPFVPHAPPGRTLSPVVQVQMEHQEMARRQFTDLIERARAMSIPVITQSQFLFLTGYTGSTAMHHR